MIEKRIKKLVEELIEKYADDYATKFSEEDKKVFLKHKSKIAELAIEDNEIEMTLKDLVEDCIGAYLLKKSFQKEDKKYQSKKS